MPHLFKYVTPDTARKIIGNGTLRWSTPPLLNDPFDMQFAFQLRIDRRAVLEMAREKLWQHYSGELLERPLNVLGQGIRHLRDTVPGMSREELRQEFDGADDESIDILEKNVARYSEEILSQFANDKIFCLSDLPDSILMWAYYAQNHAGMVLRFTDETPNSPLTQAKPVQYVEQMPSLFDDEKLSDELAGYNCMTPRRIIDEIVWTKSSHWDHEREWRVYAGIGRGAAPYEDIPFNPKELDGVIFGVRTIEADRMALANLVRARYPHVEILQARARTDAYGLTIEHEETMMPKGIPSLTKKVQRGPASWTFIYVMLGFALAIETTLIAFIEPLKYPWNLLVMAAAIAMTIWLFLFNAWFQNKLIGWQHRIENAWRKI